MADIIGVKFLYSSWFSQRLLSISLSIFLGEINTTLKDIPRYICVDFKIVSCIKYQLFYKIIALAGNIYKLFTSFVPLLFAHQPFSSATHSLVFDPLH
jgi:hypothetical protein